MNFKKIIMVFTIILTITACANVQDVEIVKKSVEIVNKFLHPEKIDKPVFDDVVFNVANIDYIYNNFVDKDKISYEEFNTMFKKDFILISLDTKNYKNLGNNMSEISVIISEQNKKLKYYKDNVK